MGLKINRYEAMYIQRSLILSSRPSSLAAHVGCNWKPGFSRLCLDMLTYWPRSVYSKCFQQIFLFSSWYVSDAAQRDIFSFTNFIYTHSLLQLVIMAVALVPIKQFLNIYILVRLGLALWTNVKNVQDRVKIIGKQMVGPICNRQSWE